jgi:hypothetical protein
MNPNIQFIPQNDACFLCPKSAFENFTEFLKQENVTVLMREEAGASGGEPFYLIEVSDVDLSESKRLISKFIMSLKPS